MDTLEKTLCDLVSINSVNPDLVPGAPGEKEIALYIAHWLEAAGCEVQLTYPVAGRPNVIAIARGTGNGRTLLLNGHMDTVGAGGMQAPFSPKIRDGRLYGRGAYDMKGGLTACMLAMKAIQTRKLRGDVVFCAVMDEEYASLGTQALAGEYKADGAIVTEFTELQLILAHRGFVWFDVETQGKAAHGSRPDLGVDAISKMGKFLVELERLDHELRYNPTHPLLGSSSLHASLIKGGKEMSTYPDRCNLGVEWRSLPGETPADVESRLAGILVQIQGSDPNFHAILKRGLDRSPLETPPSAAIVNAVQAAGKKVLGGPLPVAGVQFWTDAALLSQAGIPSVLFGPSGSGAHADEEWVDLASVRTCSEIIQAAARDFCQ